MMTKEKKTAVTIRSEGVNQYMKMGDKQEPSFVYNPGVYNNIKCKEVAKLKGERDLVKSLREAHRMETSEGSGSVIRKVGAIPFSLSYWVTNQPHVCREIARQMHMKFTYDAMGGKLFEGFVNPNGIPCGPLLLYSAVSKFGGKIVPIFQWITEAHRSSDIASEILFFHSEAEVPFPKEAVSDESLGILNALALVYTGHKTARRYSNAMYKLVIQLHANKNKGINIPITVPECYLRIDGFHFEMKYARHLHTLNLHPATRTMYLAALGHLITRTDLKEAGKILHCIFALALSKYGGILNNNEPSVCAKSEKYLITQITSKSISKYDKDYKM